ncbi:MAG: SPOR domain-containing protein [Bacteroidales bacterium]|nr:SPOR domain-containing protein [Bacteroidales bacterium]
MLELVSKSIRALIKEHDYAIVPNLGGFVTKYKSAELLPSKGIILPPSKSIAFNRKLIDDDGLLVHKMAIIGQVSLETAKEHLQEFIKKAFQQLDEARPINIEQLGTLKYNKNLQLEFELKTKDNFNPYSYGLTSLHCEPIQTKAKVKQAQKKILSRSILSKVAIVLPFVIVGVLLSYYIKDHSISELKQTAEFFSWFDTSTVKNDTSKQNQTKTEVEAKIDEQTQKQNALKYIEPKVEQTVSITEDTKVDKASAEIEEDEPINNSQSEMQEEPVKTIDKTAKYQLVAGSFKASGNANRLQKKLEKLGYPAIVVHQAQRYRVIASAYSDKIEAIQAKDSLKAQHISTWVNTLN